MVAEKLQLAEGSATKRDELLKMIVLFALPLAQQN